MRGLEKHESETVMTVIRSLYRNGDERIPRVFESFESTFLFYPVGPRLTPRERHAVIGSATAHGARELIVVPLEASDLPPQAGTGADVESMQQYASDLAHALCSLDGDWVLILDPVINVMVAGGPSAFVSRLVESFPATEAFHKSGKVKREIRSVDQPLEFVRDFTSWRARYTSTQWSNRFIFATLGPERTSMLLAQVAPDPA